MSLSDRIRGVSKQFRNQRLLVGEVEGDLSGGSVKATGGTTFDTLADWVGGVEKGDADAAQVEYVQAGAPEFDFDLFDSGFTRYAQFSERHTLPGPHVGSGYAAHHIDVVAEGSGANLPTSNDLGLSLSFRKENYDTTDAQTGEMDAVWINVIQGGPDAPATGETRSAAANIIGSLQSWGQVGFSTFVEADVAQKNRTTGTIEHSVHVYIATLDINTDAQTGHGFIADAGTGTLDAAFLARSEHGSNTGTWAYLFQGANDGVTTFSVTPNGAVSDAVGRLQAVPRSTTTALAAIGNAINTTNKFAGKLVINTTTGAFVTASDATAGGVWLALDGTTAHTPV